MPAVSVIVPNYNHARFLRQRIDTILAQTYRDFELILLDDCSTDDSRPILRDYVSDPRAHLECNETNSGSPFKQWNKGVRLAQGKYIWIAESDDYADPRFLERLIVLLDSDPAIAFAFCRSWSLSEDGRKTGYADSYLGDSDGSRWAADFCLDGREMCRQYFCRVNPIPNASAVVFCRELYERVGGADESLRLCGDWKLWAAMALTGKVAYSSEPLNYFRSHDASTRTQSLRAYADVAEHLQACGWVLRNAPVSDTLVEEVCDSKVGYWTAALMSSHVPFSVKRAILRQVRSLDPHPLGRAIRPAIQVVRQKFRRHWREFRRLKA